MKRKQRWVLWLLVWVMAGNLGLYPAPLAAAPPRQGDMPQSPGYTYGECSRAEEASIQAEMHTIAQGILHDAGTAVAMQEMVERKWVEVGVGPVLSQAVDAAVLQVQQETGYWDRFWSGWSAGQAGELAEQVATYTFADPRLTAKLEELSAALAAGLVAEMESAAAQSASSALLCLQSYVGSRYSATLFAAFEAEIASELDNEPWRADAGDVQLDSATLHAKGLTGLGVIIAGTIVRRVTQTLAQKVTSRLAGKITGRVLGRLGSSAIPYVGWAVGIGLVVWDLVEGSQGALPQIQTALQSQEVQQVMQDEIALVLREELAAESTAIATTMSAELMESWQTFCTQQHDLCLLAANNESFRFLLETTPVAELDALAQLVDLYLRELGAEALSAALEDGTIEALVALPREAYEILAWSRSPAKTLAWADVAGSRLDQVVQLDLYRDIDPTRLDALSLAAILAIGDNALIHKLLSLPPAQLDVLLQRPTAELQAIGAQANTQELGRLAEYLAGLDSATAAQVSADLAAGRQTITGLLAAAENAAPANAGDDAGDEPVAVAARDTEAGVNDIDSDSNDVDETGWMQPETWMRNGVVPAALLLIVLLVAAGVIATLRSERSSRRTGP